MTYEQGKLFYTAYFHYIAIKAAFRNAVWSFKKSREMVIGAYIENRNRFHNLLEYGGKLNYIFRMSFSPEEGCSEKTVEELNVYIGKHV